MKSIASIDSIDSKADDSLFHQVKGPKLAGSGSLSGVALSTSDLHHRFIAVCPNRRDH